MEYIYILFCYDNINCILIIIVFSFIIYFLTATIAKLLGEMSGQNLRTA